MYLICQLMTRDQVGQPVPGQYPRAANPGPGIPATRRTAACCGRQNRAGTMDEKRGRVSSL